MAGHRICPRWPWSRLAGSCVALVAATPAVAAAASGPEVEAASAAHDSMSSALEWAVRTRGLASVVRSCEESLQVNRGTTQGRWILHRLCAGSYGLSRAENLRLRGVLRAVTRDSTATLVSPGEPGEPLVVRGTVRGPSGAPVAGALIEVFHADARGEYTAARRMDEPLARLFGFLRTGNGGGYEFHTIRPGGYAGAPIPQHVHLRVSAPGYREHRCRSTCQLVFDDDPRLTPEWQEWARRDGNPILAVQRGRDGVQRCSYDVVLEPE